MAQILKIIIVLSACHFIAFYVISRLTPYREKLQHYLIASIISITIALLTRSIFIGYIATFFICLHFSSKANPSERIGLFFGQAFTLSFSIGFYLNPGIDLGGLSYPRILIIALLLPLLFFSHKEREIARFNAIDKAVMLYFVWVCLVNFRYGNLTGTMRENLWIIIDYVIPYLAIRFYTKNYALVFAAMSFSLLSQALAGIVESFLTWHIHTDIEAFANIAERTNAMYKFRGSFLRAQTSFMNPLVYALFANMAFLCSVIYISKIGIDEDDESYSRKFAWLGLAISAFGTLASGSRAGIAGSILIVAVSMILLWAVSRKQDPKKLLVIALIGGIVTLFFVGQDFIRENFEYRVRLLEVSSEVVMSNPIFGHMEPTKDPRMQVLIQGEGIIDLVNTYLIIVLYYGFPALILFIYSILTCLSRLYSSLRHCEGVIKSFGIFAFASTFILAFNLITTSAGDWTGAWIWLTLAVGSNIVARTRWEINQKSRLLE